MKITDVITSRLLLIFLKIAWYCSSPTEDYIITLYKSTFTYLITDQTVTKNHRVTDKAVITHRTQHFYDGNEKFDDFVRVAKNTDDAVGRHGTTGRVDFDLDTKVLTHVPQFGTSLTNHTAGLALVDQHPQLTLFMTTAL